MEQNAKVVTRRRFLGRLSALAGSLAAGLAAVIGVGFLFPVARRKPPPLFVCLASEVPRDRVLEIKDPQGRKVLLMHRHAGTLVAFGTVCPHLGCSVYFRPSQEQFECPCHQGVFDADGNPVSGPPQEPLHRYPVEIREGKIFIQFA